MLQVTIVKRNDETVCLLVARFDQIPLRAIGQNDFVQTPFLLESPILRMKESVVDFALSDALQSITVICILAQHFVVIVRSGNHVARLLVALVQTANVDEFVINRFYYVIRWLLIAHLRLVLVWSLIISHYL